MESDGARVTSLPPAKGRKVLRPGVRIIAEQFCLDREPDVSELTFGELMRTVLGGSGFSHSWKHSSFGTAAHDLAEAARKLEESVDQSQVYVYRGQRAVGFVIDEVYEEKALERLQKSDHPPVHLKFDNSGRIKNQPQSEPFYVAKTKRKRR